MPRPKGSKNKPKSADAPPRKPRTQRTPAPSAAQGRAQRQASVDRSNGVDAGAVTEILEALLETHEERLSIMGKAMNECRVTHQADKELLTEAKANGHPVRAIKSRFKQILLERKARKIRDDLEQDDKVMLDMVIEATRKALGEDFADDMPLGQAAVADAERRARAVGSLVGGADADAESAARNAEALAGMKQLN